MVNDTRRWTVYYNDDRGPDGTVSHGVTLPDPSPVAIYAQCCEEGDDTVLWPVESDGKLVWSEEKE